MTLSRSRKWLTCGPDSDVLSSVRLGDGRERHGGLTAVVHMSRVYSSGVLADHLVKKQHSALKRQILKIISISTFLL